MNFKKESLSKDYNKFNSFEDIFENELAERIISVAGKNELKMLDLGGGTGKFSEIFRDKTLWDITVADYSAAMLEQGKLKNFKTVVQDLNDINLNEKFDVIIIKFCIHYVKENKIFYESLSKILNENGKIFIVTRPKRTEFPFSEKLHLKWEKSQPSVDEILSNSENFEKNIEILKFPVNMKLKQWKDIIVNKVYSHIEDEDAEEARLNIPDNNDDISFTESIILIQLKNHF
jgi:ubiquinone/menaquinone biosynthesis C-methylase UbiE